MSDLTRAAVCQRCGPDFVLTTTYRDFVTWRDAKVKVPREGQAVLFTSRYARKGPEVLDVELIYDR